MAFIRVFLSLLYTTEPEIGYDPTVYREQPNKNGEICYVYEVGTEEQPQYYRTTKLLFMARVLCITGRMTRVWKAIEVKRRRNGEFGETIGGEVVLKDGWLDEGSQSEKEIQTAIFASLRNIKSEAYQWAGPYLHRRLIEAFQGENYKEYFMEILDSRRLGKTKKRAESAKPNPRILSFAQYKPVNPRHLIEGSMQSGNRSGLPDTPPSHNPQREPLPREYKIKEQHRLIYSHVGRPLNDAKNLSDSFRAIHDTLFGAPSCFSYL